MSAQRRNVSSIILAVLGFGTFVSGTLCVQRLFSPVAVVVSSDIEYPLSISTPVALSAGSTSLATLDYGYEIAGYPYFEISELSNPVQIEVKYTEQYHALSFPWADGPYSFSNGLSNTFRVEAFNISSTGIITSSLLQGGQRWQTIRLLTDGNVTFSRAGFRPTIDYKTVDQFPGQFSSNDETLNEVFKLGARAANAACVSEGSQKPIWTVDPVDGIYVRSTRPAQNVELPSLQYHTLEFDVKIDRAGAWWSMAWPLSRGDGIQLNLISDLPNATTFVNTNTSLTPPNTLSLVHGYGFVNQTTIPSYFLDSFQVPTPVHEHNWYTIRTNLSANGHLSVSLDGHLIFDISLSEYWTPNGISAEGAFGLGAYQDQAAHYRNVKVYDSTNGSLLYHHSMTTPDVLAIYGTQANLGSVCLDGPKRDRLVWLGDFYHTAGIIGTSTSRFDLTRGTLQFLLDSQASSGQLAIAPPMGYDPLTTTESFAVEGKFGLEDYQILGFLAFSSYIRQTNDLKWAAATWPRWQLQINWLLSQINSTDGLVHLSSAFLGPATAGSAVSCSAAQMLFEAADIATTLNDTASATTYHAAATSLAAAINTRLWNDVLGVYSLSIDSPNDYSTAGIGFCVTSGVANATQAARAVSPSVLSGLGLGPGYKDDTTVNSSAPDINISPNTNGFLLPALLIGNAASTAGDLMRTLWGSMLQSGASAYGNNYTSSGASWEYVSAADHGPGLSLFTSLSHPWGGAPTYILTQWAAGLRAAEGTAGFGYKNWVVAPGTGIEMGLSRASATVVTREGKLSVSWVVIGNGTIDITVEAPAGTSGKVIIGSETIHVQGGKTYRLNAVV